jgi:ureidoglycolate dehydrogenase (NAD+)
VTASLLFAERRGIASHGLVRLRVYLQRIRAGGINPAARMRKLSDREAVAVVDADHAPGAAAGLLAVDLVSEKARRHGVGVVVVRNGNHFGAAGFYARALADAGLIGLVACNTDAAVAPPGGGARVLGTNPLAMAIPATPQGTQPLLDMATSEVSYGKLIVARDEGRSIPEGWAVDRAGRGTTDPAAGLEGALLPAAGPKGFGLAFMVDVLSALGGGVTSPEAGRLYGPPDVPQRLGFFFLAIAPEFFIAPESLAAAVEHLTRAVRHSRPDGHALGEPMVPGEPEARHAARTPGRLLMSPPLVAELSALGTESGVPFPSPAV